MAQTKLACCNSFNLPRHSWGSRKKNLRSVSAWMCKRATICICKIFDTCRKKLKRSPIIAEISDNQVGGDNGGNYVPETGVHADIPSDSETEPGVFVNSPATISSLNQGRFEIGVTPYSKAKACQPCYSHKKMREITKAMRRTIISAESDDDESDLIKQLKFKFKTTTEGGEQVTHSQCFAQKLVVSSCKVYLESESAVRVMYTTAILPV